MAGSSRRVYLDAPGVGGVVQVGQYVAGNVFAVRKNLREVLGAQHGPEGGRGQQLGALGVVGDVADGGHGVADLVVHDRVHRHGDAVFGQDLLRWHVEGDCPQVDHHDVVHAGVDEEEAWPHSPTLLDPP